MELLDERTEATTGLRWRPLLVESYRSAHCRPAGTPALLETVGRKSGRLRRTPVGNGLKGDTFWIIAEHGRYSGWVRNIVDNPNVRVKVNGRWRKGVAYQMLDDDPIARQRELDPFNARLVRLFGTELTTVRIDLDPEKV